MTNLDQATSEFDSTNSSQSEKKKFFGTPTFDGQDVDLSKVFAQPEKNLNNMVNEILSKMKVDTSEFKSVIRHNSRAPKEKRRRLRKNREQSKYLEKEFSKDPNWTKPTITRLAKELRLKESQIYKWNWDTRKKMGLYCEETIF